MSKKEVPSRRDGRPGPAPARGAIDDASSQILALHFRPAEDLHGCHALCRFARTGSRRDGVLIMKSSSWQLFELPPRGMRPGRFVALS